MFLWRNILSAVCWFFCCTPLFAQEIDYSKCSCDSIARYHSYNYYVDETSFRGKYGVLRKDNLISFTANYNDYKRIITINSFGDTTFLKSCTYINGEDSIIVTYRMGQSNIQGRDWEAAYARKNNLPESFAMKKDSICFLFDTTISKQHIEFYYWGYYWENDTNYLDIDYKWRLAFKIISYKKSKSVLYNYDYKENTMFLESIINLDSSGFIDGKYIAYTPDAKVKAIHTYRHGTKNGYYYHKEGYEYDKGYFANDKQSGKWIYKRDKYLIFVTGQKKRYILKYKDNGEIYARRFLFYKKINSDGDIPLLWSFDNSLDASLRNYKLQYMKLPRPYSTWGFTKANDQ